ncbi:hypothetical protein MASR1M32_40310 [Rhodobacter sp.]
MQMRIVTGDAGMGEAGQIGIGDGGTIDGKGQMAKPGAKDHAKGNRRIAGAGVDGGEGVLHGLAFRLWHAPGALRPPAPPRILGPK